MVEANHLRNFITDLTIFKVTEHFHLIHKKGQKWGGVRGGGSQQTRTSLRPSERQKGDGNRLVEQEQNNRKEEKQEGTE